MDFKDRMMKAMIGRMSKEEKLAMMPKMMEEFFSGFEDEEKSEIMMNMMPKMMSQIRGSGGMAVPMEGVFGADEEMETRMKEMMEFCGQMMEGHGGEFMSQMMNRCMEFMRSEISEGKEAGEDS